MAKTKELRFKIASTTDEFEQIHRLNYRTFVEEIPQHTPNPERRLVDRFHAQNTYVICLRGTKLVGMMALRADRPFSLDAKVPELDGYLPSGRSVCEVRLMAVEPGERRGRVFWGLLLLGFEYAQGRGWNLFIGSGSVRQLKLFRNLGFVSFGPLVGVSEALFQPIYLTAEAFAERAHAIEARARIGVQPAKTRRRRPVPATG